MSRQDPTENPFPESPGGEEHALASVRAEIESWADVPAEFKAYFAQKAGSFVEREVERGRPGTHFQIGQLGWTYWAIKDDDLELLRQLGPAAMGIVTFVSVAGAPVAVLAAGLAWSMLTIARNFKGKSVTLEAEDYRVLMALKQAGPSTAMTVGEILGGLHIHGSGVWDEARTVAALKRLKQMFQRDGVVTALVSEVDGIWTTSGI
jgi:hypothetical protein